MVQRGVEVATVPMGFAVTPANAKVGLDDQQWCHVHRTVRDAAPPRLLGDAVAELVAAREPAEVVDHDVNDPGECFLC